MIEHALLSSGFPANAKVNAGFSLATDLDRLLEAAQMTESILDNVPLDKGYIVTKEANAKKQGPDLPFLSSFFWSVPHFFIFGWWWWWLGRGGASDSRFLPLPSPPLPRVTPLSCPRD